MASKPTGAVFYQGPSCLVTDSGPSRDIVGIVTFESSNAKTGNMPQVWFLDDAEPPMVAAQAGHDTGVCGDCPLRYAETGVCYVVLIQGPRAVWQAYKAGRYPKVTASQANAMLREHGKARLGAYGDPASVPLQTLLDLTRGLRCTGYTHQWRRAPALRNLCMASLNSAAEIPEARSQGWRFFLFQAELGTMADPKVRVCLNTTHGRLCKDCLLCNGSGHGANVDIVVQAHGSGAGNIDKVGTKVA